MTTEKHGWGMGGIKSQQLLIAVHVSPSEVGAAAGQSRETDVLTATGTVGVGPLCEVVAVEEELWEEGGAGGGEVTQPLL